MSRAPDWESRGGSVQLYCGDCLEILSVLEAGNVNAVVTDPPYGANNDCDYTRFVGGRKAHERNWPRIVGDNQPFVPDPWLEFPRVILWGYQYFANKLPLGTILIWFKKYDSMIGKWLSDCELAWQKGGRGVWVYSHRWQGVLREGEEKRKVVLHPTQKPVALMRWCIERVTKEGDTVLDPYMGSGSTGVAAIQCGRKFIGIEIEQVYFDVAHHRIEAATQQLRLPLEMY